MQRRSEYVLPTEAGYTGHWDAQNRRDATQRWLHRRERDVAVIELGHHRTRCWAIPPHLARPKRPGRPWPGTSRSAA